MRLTTKSQYGLQALVQLIEHYREQPDQFLQVGKISERLDIPRKYLEQVLLTLANAGVIESKKGRHGGYRLRSDPSEITLGEVIRAAEGRLSPLPSWVGTEERSNMKGLAEVLCRVQEAVTDILDTTSIEVLVYESPHELETNVRALMYHI